MSTAISKTRGSHEMLPRFRPFDVLRREFDQLFGPWSEWNGNWNWMGNEFSAACDLSETADAFEVRMDVPGIKPDEITVEVTGDLLKISGERKEEKEQGESGKTYHRIERRHGTFSETVRLPGAVKEDQVQAEFHDGVLTVTLPKIEASKTHTVKVKANGR
jgi:HSP20 family protein